MAYDTNLMLINAAATATITGTGKQIDGTSVLDDAYIRVIVQSVSGTSPTLDITIQECATLAGTYQTVTTFKQITAAGAWTRKYFSNYTFPFVRALATIGGTSPNFGTLQVGFSTGVTFKGGAEQ